MPSSTHKPNAGDYMRPTVGMRRQAATRDLFKIGWHAILFGAALLFVGLILSGAFGRAQAMPERETYQAQTVAKKVNRAVRVRTLHSYNKRHSRYHARRLSRWKFKKPVRPVGVPPPGFRAQLTRAPAALQSHLRQIDQINGAPVKIDAVCRPGGRFFSKATGRWHVSEHDGCKAVDFTPRPDRRSAVLSYARRNIPGYMLTYGWSPHIHIDLSRSGRKTWPVAEPTRETARVPLPRPRPVLAGDFAVLSIEPDWLRDTAAIDSEAMLVAIYDAPGPVAEPLPPSRNVFEAFADSLLRPVGNCKGWDRIAPGVKRIASDAARHFSRKYGLVLIVEANSCYRDTAHNRRVRGARYSAHLNYTALDFKITAPDHSWAVPAAELWAFCKSHKLARGCGVYRYQHIIHADVNQVRRGLVTWDWRARRPTRLAKVAAKKKK